MTNLPGVMVHEKFGPVRPYEVYTREMVNGVRYLYQNYKRSLAKGFEITGDAAAALRMAEVHGGHGSTT